MTNRNDDQSKSVSRVRSSAAAPVGTPNVQGKGQIGFLKDWVDSTPRGVTAKSAGRLLSDYFTSILVLSADFKFKPVFGKDYYLYREEPRWTLSLISPDDWNSTEKREAFVGTCVLHPDSTWTIVPSNNLQQSGRVADAIASAYSGFVDRLDSEHSLEDDLPFYEGRLPYYQRLFAAALSRSLKASLTYGQQLEIGARQWRTQLPPTPELLARPSADAGS